MRDQIKGFPDLPPIWALAMLAASYALARYVPIFPVPISYIPGVAFIAIGFGMWGIILILWAAIWFRRKKTPIMPGQEPRTLLVEGPFRINRNPIYGGMLMILAAAALVFGDLSAWPPVFLFRYVITRRFILPEEAALKARFGAEAETYFRETKRW